MSRGYYRGCTTGNPFVNRRYDGIMAVISSVIVISTVILFISWWLCLI